jgi:hypothetical protein
MTTTIVCLFNLKPGVTVADYEAWARSVDMPTVRGLSSIAGFEVLRSAGVLGSDAAPPYQYIEIIQVKDMGVFGAEVSTAAMQAVAGQFQGFADAPTFILTETLGA